MENKEKELARINVLGETYRIIESNQDKDSTLKEADGYCDHSDKTICIDETLKVRQAGQLKNLDTFYRNKVLRHEIVHAFFFESGLGRNSDFADNEELVDWIAYQIPKMAKVMEECGIL